MGSFYGTCSISGMSLTNQNTTIQLLVPSWRDKVVFDEKGMLCSNSGCQHSYSPFGFPIYGRYDEDSTLDDIKRDKNVEKLEKFFNLSIDNIINASGDDRWYKHGIKEPDSVGDWALPTLDGGEIKNVDVLLVMTFTYFRTEVYDFLSTNYVKADYETYTTEHMVSNFRKMVKDLPSVDVDPSVEVGKLDHYSVISTYVLEKYDSLDMSNEEFLEKARELMTKVNEDTVEPDVLERLNTLAYSMVSGDYKTNDFYINSICHYNFLKLLNIDSSFKDEMWKQYTFLWSMGALYKNLFPSNYGSQSDNFRQLRDLNNLVGELLDKDIEETYNADND